MAGFDILDADHDMVYFWLGHIHRNLFLQQAWSVTRVLVPVSVTRAGQLSAG